MARLCWEELKKKGRVEKVESRWEKERRRFLKKKGVELEEMERRRRECDWFGGRG